jgi:membrane protease YdiL (CAAX protease family)
MFILYESAKEKRDLMTKRKLFMLYLLIPSIALVFLETYPIVYSSNQVLDPIIKVIVTRFVGCLVFIPLSIYMEYNIFALTTKNRIKVLLCTLVPLAVVINNLPIIGLITKNAYIVEPISFVLVFALEAIMIGMFEEFAFRGVLFPFILENRKSSTKSIFWATVISSSAFGAVHLLNIFAGAGIGGVLLQVGYSFLIGGMCAIVLLYTRCIWICVALHAIYDFCGYLVPTLGDGIIWDPITVIITTILGLFALIFMTVWLLRINPDRVNELYNNNATP